ncbi:FAD/NAD(P)-binding oxidoreductase [Agromyces luteolus]|uniref:NAD(P)/FAD-dependent oxidoreductase n=1 Tax=Agromyces luteolus TaxID=88373 RepID=A0A7C9HJF2_9MICO|nr:FAD-dependent oxidoreductase [Agromyces luteolus]MUN08503.1 NAD(P)/FAD-dependent oxidoreductase [Agromyces luteolus]GLK27037.1 FAD/NAD(P)-binding oxidoreductase [Agromyces luteolus]
MSPLRIVLIGYGPVGARFVEELLPAARGGAVALTVVAGEPVEAYNRVLVAEYAVGNADLDAMLVGDREAAEAAGAAILLGVRATRIDRDAHLVHLSTGEALPYDRLVLATGSRANVPTLDGVERPRRDLADLERHPARLVARDDELPAGVTALRDLDDAERVLAAVRGRRRIVVLGAGVLGLELALAAAHAGAQVCVVHHGPHPMPRNLDRGGGHVLRSALRRTGITVIAHSRAEAIGFRTDEDGTRRFDMLVTADGKQVRGDLLVLSCGVSPRNELATLAGLRTAVGVVVGPDLRSWSDPDVFAIGDCAQVVERTDETAGRRILPGAPSGLIGPGWRQAEHLAGRFAAEAADPATGSAAAPLPPERDAIVMLKAEHVDVVAVGDVSADPWDDDALSPRRRVAQWADPEHLRYVKMVTEDGILTGFASVGMPRTAAELTLLFERRAELPADRSLLLRFDGPDDDPAANADAFAPETTVCWCNGVTVGRIQESAACGNTTVECVGRDTRAGTGCGGCRGRIADVLARAAEADGAPSLTG